MDEETKAKIMVWSVVMVLLVGGTYGIFALLRLAGGVRDDTSGLAETSRIMEKRERERLIEVQKQEKERQKLADAERTKLRNAISLALCDGRDEVAGELLSAIESVNSEIEGAFAAGNAPENIPVFLQGSLVRKIAQNDVLRRFFGSRSSTLAQAIFGGALQKATRGSDPSGLPDFLASGKYVSMGSGFFVAPDGWFLTNQHVVGDAKVVDIRLPNGDFKSARVVKTDALADLALAKVEGAPLPDGWLPLSKGDASMGAGVFTIGFPKPTVQGIEPKFTDGRVSSLSGMHDDKSNYQISVPVQSGNSGGPLVHVQSGWVVGMVCAKLVGDTADAPQNVNYAIKTTVIQSFLNSTPARASIDGNTGTSTETESAAIARVKGAIALVLVKRTGS